MTSLAGAYQVSLDISAAELLAIAPAEVQAEAARQGAAEPGGGSSTFKSIEDLGLKLNSPV